MDLYLKVLKGPRKDDVFKIADKITLGRSKADLNLKDTKTSGIHGEIVLEKGVFVFIDNSSTNGTFYNGERVDRVTLKPGVSFKIGSSELEVVTDLALKKSPQIELSEWRESLYFQTAKLSTTQNPNTVYALPEVIKVKIASGLMRGEEFLLGYGPRTLGGGSSDILVAGEAAPLVRFELGSNGRVILIDQTGGGFVFSGNVTSSVEITNFLSVQCGDLVLDVSTVDEANS